MTSLGNVVPPAIPSDMMTDPINNASLGGLRQSNKMVRFDSTDIENQYRLSPSPSKMEGSGDEPTPQQLEYMQADLQ